MTSRLRLELRSKAPQASRISTTLSGRKRVTLISTFYDINFVTQQPAEPAAHLSVFPEKGGKKPVSKALISIKIKCNMFVFIIYVDDHRPCRKAQCG